MSGQIEVRNNISSKTGFLSLKFTRKIKKMEYNREMKNFLDLSDQQIEETNKKVIEDTTKEYQEFKDALVKEICYMCNKSFSSFDVNEPCLHWLLRPPSFDKKHLPLVYSQYDYNRIQPYLRWLANAEVPFKNINDLVEEKSSKKIIENTIRYKNFEW